MVQKCKKWKSGLAVLLALVLVLSVLPPVELTAAETNVINDANGDGSITLDEVDSAQLATYGVVTGYGVTGFDVPGSITSSIAYTSALSEVAGSENTIIIGTVADGKVTFGEWFQNLCTNVYAEITGADVIGYTVARSCTVDDLIEKLNSLYSGSTSSSSYTTAYNLINNNDFTNDIVVFGSDKMQIYYGVSDYVESNNFLSSYYINRVYYDSSNNLQTTILESRYYQIYEGGYFQSSGSGYIEFSSDFYVINSSLVIFESISDLTNYMDLKAVAYYNSKSSCDCNSRGDTVATLNAYDWSAVSSSVYTSVSSAVTDANATTVAQVQDIIDSEMEDLSEFIEEKEDSGSSEGGSEGSESNSDISNKLEQGNQLQQESNELQQENNELQKEENETSKGILGKITEFFGSFFDNLIDSIVGIFIPDGGFFETYFDDLYDFFTQKLGFLMYPFTLVVDFINAFLDIGEGSGEIVINDVVLFDTVIIPATTYNLKSAMSEVLGDYYEIYYAFVDVIFLFAFVGFGKKKFDSIVGGTGQ